MKLEKDQQTRKGKVVRHNDLDVYQRAFAVAMAEAWRKRRYAGSFVSKLNDAEGEAAETQTWLQFAVECGYAKADATRAIYAEYDNIIGMLVNMQNHPEQWALTQR